MSKNISNTFTFGIVGAVLLGALALIGVSPLLTNAQTSDVTVTIVKFVDGAQATATSSQSASFPIAASWSATSTGTGSGSFALGPTGFNTSEPYQAMTADMTSGASYSITEEFSGSSVGATCAAGKPFRLQGYTTGTSLSGAAAATPTTTSPSLTNIEQDMFIIVWNRHCIDAPTPIFPLNGSATTTAGQQMIDWSDVTNPVGGISYIYQSSNASTTDSNGAFTSPVFTSGALASSSIATPGTPPGTYFWHVRASDSAGNQSDWSPVWSFIVLENGTTTPPTATTTAQVHVLKYLDGQQATASSSSSFLFPMTATWHSASLNGGATTTGSYTLGNNFGGASQQYGAQTAEMDAPAHYSTSEVTGTSTGQVLPIGAACSPGRYQLVGYTTSSLSFANAASKTPTASVPTFNNLASDRYVIVWNRLCTSTTPQPGTGSIEIKKFTIGGGNASTTFSFIGNGGIAPFTITTHGKTEEKLLTNLQPGRYAIAEVNIPSGWRRFINTCDNVRVRAGHTAHCFIVNRVPVNANDRIGTSTDEQLPN